MYMNMSQPHSRMVNPKNEYTDKNRTVYAEMTQLRNLLLKNYTLPESISGNVSVCSNLCINELNVSIPMYE